MSQPGGAVFYDRGVATTEEPVSGLDQLIGEVEADAARRRSAPGFPHDLEARINAELARQSPAPSGRVPLERLVTSVEEASFINIDAPTLASRREYAMVKGTLKRGMAWYFRYVADQVSALGFTTARTLRAFTVRLSELEDRLSALEVADGPAPATSLAGPSSAGEHLGDWLEEVTEQLRATPGRILYADADAEAVVRLLRAAGLDAYGLARAGDPYRVSPDVRYGDLLAHLDTVEEAALAGALLAGCTDAMDGATLRGLTDHLARCVQTDGIVAIVSEAPWWWHLRLDPAAADLAETKPLSAETWLAFLHNAGFEATACYATDGRSYAVAARREASPGPR